MPKHIHAWNKAAPDNLGGPAQIGFFYYYYYDISQVFQHAHFSCCNYKSPHFSWPRTRWELVFPEKPLTFSAILRFSKGCPTHHPFPSIPLLFCLVIKWHHGCIFKAAQCSPQPVEGDSIWPLSITGRKWEALVMNVVSTWFMTMSSWLPVWLDQFSGDDVSEMKKEYAVSILIPHL